MIKYYLQRCGYNEGRTIRRNTYISFLCKKKSTPDKNVDFVRKVCMNASKN